MEVWQHGWNGGTKNASLQGKPREKAGKWSGTMLGWIQTIHCKKELKRCFFFKGQSFCLVAELGVLVKARLQQGGDELSSSLQGREGNVLL